MKDIISIVKSLQKVSELRMDKDEPVGATRWASKRNRDDEDISELLANTETLLAHNGDYEDDSGQATPRAIPLKHTWCWPKVKPF